MIGITTAGITGRIENFSSMRDAGIQQIDCSVTAILKTPSVADVDLHDVISLNETLGFYKIRCNSLQSIFFGIDNIFEDLRLFNSHIEKCFNIVERLDCDTILFGSPQQRKNVNFAKRLIKSMNEIALHRNKVIAIENLDLFDGVWGQKASDIQKEIIESELSRCSINLHVFVEDTLDISSLESSRIRSIHLSNKSYETGFLENANIETLEKVKDLYRKVPNLCLEVTKCSLQQSIHEFDRFRKKWEYL